MESIKEYKREIIIFIISVIISILVFILVGLPHKEEEGIKRRHYHDEPATEQAYKEVCEDPGYYGCNQYKRVEYTINNQKSREFEYLFFLVFKSLVLSFLSIEIMVYIGKKCIYKYKF